MGRLPRIQENQLHYHIIVRCNNEAFHFETKEDFERYLNTLSFFKKRHRFKLYNYVLMNSHVHLLLQPSEKTPLQETMHLINWNYAKDYNQRKNRKGHFWLDRYTSIPVQTDLYALSLMRYMDRNPIRAGIIKKPDNWQWGGYRFYAFGEPNSILDSHVSYLALGSKDKIRQENYKNFVTMILPGEDQKKHEFSKAAYIGSESFARRLGLSK
ncbi:MAG: transposase [Deltaproteobacteria bacterium]|nr:transposase [Deltaproteobacteria bacterium]